MQLTLTVIALSLMAGTATCSVLGHECAIEISCPPIDSSCTEAYPTSRVFEDSVCPWCLVCIDKSTPLDETGCPDREVMCQGSRSPPSHCKAQIIFNYNNNTCNYCDENICVRESDVQFVGSN